MWPTVLLLAVAVSFEPVRVGLTVAMLNRPRPMLQLTAFLCGGFLMGLSVGLAVLLVVKQQVPTVTGLSIPAAQIVVGAVALLVAATLAADFPRRRQAAAAASRPGFMVKLSTPLQRILGGHSLWIAGLAGSGTALPSIDYLAALAVIGASGSTPATQTGALVVFNIVAFAFVEVPLVGYLLAPVQTRAYTVALHRWIRSRRRRDVAAVLAGAGCVLTGVGVARL